MQWGVPALALAAGRLGMHSIHQCDESIGPERFNELVGPDWGPVQCCGMHIRSTQTCDLRRLDPARNMARFYHLSIESSLFGDVALVREWGRIGRRGRLRVDLYRQLDEAQAAFVAIERAKRRRGYLDRFDVERGDRAASTKSRLEDEWQRAAFDADEAPAPLIAGPERPVRPVDSTAGPSWPDRSREPGRRCSR